MRIADPARYGAAIAAVLLMTGAIAAVPQSTSISNVSMLYLIPVLASASLLGRGPSVAASILAFVAFDALFVQPRYTLLVADPAEWVALLLFLATAIITSELAGGQRRQAREARLREREATLQYDMVRLIAAGDLQTALEAAAERLRAELHLSGVAIECSEGDAAVVSAAAGDEHARALLRRMRPAVMLGAGQAPTAATRGAPGRWIRIVPPSPPTDRTAPSRVQRDRVYSVPIVTGDRSLGWLSLVLPQGQRRVDTIDARLVSAVATQIGLAFERIRLRREASEAEVLRRTDELRAALINAVSHDLRTPLATVIAAADSLLQSDVSWTNDQRSELAESIRSEAGRLDRIVGNLLDLSRIEAGTIRPNKGWYDFRSLLDDTLGRMAAATAGRDVLIDIPDDLPPVKLDYVEIDQVLTNLIENAVNYSPPGSAIGIDTRLAGGTLVVEVKDRGPGVAPPDEARIFEPFVRGRAASGRPVGSGLGLSVARGLIVAHGGSVGVSPRVGGGSIFRFTIPFDNGQEVRNDAPRRPEG